MIMIIQRILLKELEGRVELISRNPGLRSEPVISTNMITLLPLRDILLIRPLPILSQPTMLCCRASCGMLKPPVC